MSEKYYNSLLRHIVTAGQDQTQLRMIIYQFARNELRRQLFARRDFRVADMREQMSALENAIDQLESDVADNIIFLPTDSQSGPVRKIAVPRQASTALVPAENFPSLKTVIEHTGSYTQQDTAERQFNPTGTIKPILSGLWSIVRLVVAVTLGVTLYAAMEHHGDVFGLLEQHGSIRYPDLSAASLSQSSVAEAKSTSIAAKPPASNVPIPSDYGVYAISRGRLTDLEPLPIRVPDPRIAISAVFSAPSESVLPDGRLQFLAFRRDFVNNAPDRVTVRVVARVMHALTFDSNGKPRMMDIDASWAVRSNTYEMKVAPVDGKPEMIIMRPETPAFSFPAGRYALVLQGSAYDFSVAGPITEEAQCLERTDAVDGPVYSICRAP
jgi:hypothetical protein